MSNPLRYLIAAVLILASVRAFASGQGTFQPAPYKASALDNYDPKILYRETSVGTFGIRDFYTCKLHEIEITGTDPVNGKPRILRVKDLYSSLPGDPADLPMIVMVPPIGGVSQLDTTYANEFCFLGFRVALIEDYENENVFDISMDSDDRNTIRGVAAIRHTLEYLKPSRPHQLGLMGTSAGAIIGSVAVSFDLRISSAVLLAGGGHLADIISTSDLDQFTSLRSARMKAYGFKSIDSYSKALKAHIQIEPLDFIGRTGFKKIWMMNAKRDTTVPTVDQQALYRAFGSQDLVTFNEPHIPAILHTALADQCPIQHFFESTLR